VYFREYTREEILGHLNLSDWQFRSLCALCFTEASQEINAVPIHQAYQFLKMFKSLSILKQKYPDLLNVWPDDSHIFYKSVDVIEPWIRDDQMDIYKAYMNCEPMPYT
jgi:hypothetical protein